MFTKGLSGSSVNIKENVVTKWTIGNESSPTLEYQCNKQKNELLQNNLYPIKTVNVLCTATKDSYFSFDMPHISRCVNDIDKSHHNLIANHIAQSFRNRSKIKKNGFKRIIENCIYNIRVNSLRNDLDIICKDMFNKLNNLLNEVSDFYPAGYAHGDFGIDNMLLDENSNIVMIDFAYSHIYSPLIDAATLSFSLKSDHRNKELMFLDDLIDLEFSHYLKHIDIIKILKCIEWSSKSENIDEIMKLYDSI